MLPVGELVHLFLVVLLAGDEVVGKAMAVEVMVALRLDEHVPCLKPEQANHALTARQIALR